MRHPRSKQAGLRIGLLLALLAVGGVTVLSALADPRISAKQAEVRRVLADIDQLDLQLGRAVEAYDGASYRLSQTESQLSANRYDTRVVRANLRVAERLLVERLRELYMSDSTDPTLGVLLDATSLDNLIAGLEAESQSTAETRQILDQVKTFRARLIIQAGVLIHAREAQKRLVAERAADKARIEQGLAYRHRLVASIRDEIARLHREDAIRQAELVAQARARLSEQQRIAQARTLSSLFTGPTVAEPASPIGRQVVEIALRYLGLPYVWGAAGPDAFDCSGLVLYVFAQLGISLPHFAASQWNYGVYVSKDQLEPGDLVFFDNLGHVGIYVGNGDYIEAPEPGLDVKITPLSDPWAAANYYGAKRIA